MRVAMTLDGRFPLGSEELRQKCMNLRSVFDSDDPVCLFAERVKGLEASECMLPLYITYPYAAYNRRGMDLTAPIAAICQQLGLWSYNRIFVFGAGFHTQMLLDIWTSCNGQEICGILVSAKKDECVFGLPLFEVGEVSLFENDLVVFSSDSFEQEMHKTLRRIHPHCDCLALHDCQLTHMRKTGLDSYYREFFNLDARQVSFSTFLRFIQPDVLILSDSESVDAVRAHPCAPELVIPSFDAFESPHETRKIGSSKKRFVFIDQCLRSENGHYLNYANNVLEPASLDFETSLVSLQRIASSVDSAQRLYPIFRYDAWGRDAVTNELVSRKDHSEEFSDKLVKLISMLRLGAGDHVFIPNIFDWELDDLSDALSKMDPFEARIHLFFRYDLYDDYDRIGCMKRIASLGRPIEFHVDTPELQKSHMLPGYFNANLLPIPVAATFEKDFHPTVSPQLRVVSLGVGRKVKGFVHLPQIIRRFYEGNPRSSVVFEIQNFTDDSDPKTRETVETLRDMAHEFGLILHDGPLDEKAYSGLVARGDVFLCLYDVNVYKERSSHVACEALCYGKALIVTRGCAPASLLEQDCPWIVDEPSDASEALAWIDQNREESLHYSLKYAKKYRDLMTGKKLVEYFVNQRKNENGN